MSNRYALTDLEGVYLADQVMSQQDPETELDFY